MDVFFVNIGFILKIFLCTVILNDSARAATYEVGSTVELKCKYSALVGEELKWSHLISPKPVIYSINDVVYSGLENSIKARISITGNHSEGEYRLKISNLIVSDQGRYECLITIRNLIDNYTITVIDAPYVKVTNVTYTQNDINRTITCEYIGNPITNIFYNWQQKSKYGIIIRKWNNMQSGVLTLPHIPVEKRYQDNGEYECTVGKDVNGNVIEKTGIGSMTVEASPVFTIDNDKTKMAKVIGKAELHVNVYSFPKFTTMNWYKGNGIITSSFKYMMSDEPGKVRDRFHTTDVVLDGYIFSLNISNLTVDDFTSYMIELSNNIGGSVNYTITLKSVDQNQVQDTISLQTNTIIGGVAGGLVFIIVGSIAVFVCFNRNKGKLSCWRHGKKMKVSREKLAKTSSVERSNEVNYTSAAYAETDKQKKKQKEKAHATESCYLKDNILYQPSEINSKAVQNVEYAQVLKKTNKSPSAVQITGDGNNIAAAYAVVDKGRKRNKIMTTNKTALNNQTVDEYVNADLSLKLQEDDKSTDADKSDQGFQNSGVVDDRTVYEKVENSTISRY